MPQTATLTATVIIAWQDHRGIERDCECEVAYTYDGAGKPVVTASRLLGEPSIGDGEIDELVYAEIDDRCDDDYADWLADQDAEELAA